jgi:hypothetical protein
VALTLPELRMLAERAGNAPLPFDVVETATAHPMESRLGQARGATDARAYADAVAGLHDPAETLARRGLLDDEATDAGMVGAVGLLATPAVAVDLDVAVGSVQARAWHRQRDDAVATLATTDGLVFELAWFESAAWPDELARIAAVPEDVELDQGTIPDLVDLPYELLDPGAEAVASGRPDLLGTLLAQHSGRARDARGDAVDDAATAALLGGLVSETQGRLRALVADIDDGGRVVGVVSWVLLADGWRVLRPRQHNGVRRVEVRRAEPADLAAELGPVVAEVTR